MQPSSALLQASSSAACARFGVSACWILFLTQGEARGSAHQNPTTTTKEPFTSKISNAHDLAIALREHLPPHSATRNAGNRRELGNKSRRHSRSPPHLTS